MYIYIFYARSKQIWNKQLDKSKSERKEDKTMEAMEIGVENLKRIIGDIEK